MIFAGIMAGTALLFAGASTQEEPSCVPATYAAALDCLDATLTETTRTALVSLPFAALVQTHHGLGTWIRNNWGLWGAGPLYQDMGSLGFSHPDDMSSVIIAGYWARENGCTLDLQAFAAYYQSFWEHRRAQLDASRDEEGGIPVGTRFDMAPPTPDCTDTAMERETP